MMTTAKAPEQIGSWFVGRLPEGWFTGPADVTVDREEALVIGALGEPELEADAGEDAVAAARAARARRFREETRESRIRIAEEAEHLYGRKVSWGVTCGGDRFVFTSMAVPVMTRLRLGERSVLDTLIDAGVARSRSEALAWCVRLVERNQSDWIGQLRDALVKVEELRSEGPSA